MKYVVFKMAGYINYCQKLVFIFITNIEINWNP